MARSRRDHSLTHFMSRSGVPTELPNTAAGKTSFLPFQLDDEQRVFVLQVEFVRSPAFGVNG
jgi:hypothetical protein